MIQRHWETKLTEGSLAGYTRAKGQKPGSRKGTAHTQSGKRPGGDTGAVTSCVRLFTSSHFITRLRGPAQATSALTAGPACGRAAAPTPPTAAGPGARSVSVPRAPSCSSSPGRGRCDGSALLRAGPHPGGLSWAAAQLRRAHRRHDGHVQCWRQAEAPTFRAPFSSFPVVRSTFGRYCPE